MAHHTHTQSSSGGVQGGQLFQGMTRTRPAKNKSQAHPGVAPITPFAQGSQKFQPLPDPLGQPPYHYDIQSAVEYFCTGELDFSDIIMAECCNHEDIYLMSDDHDFYGRDVKLISANKRTLRAAGLL